MFLGTGPSFFQSALHLIMSRVGSQVSLSMVCGTVGETCGFTPVTFLVGVTCGNTPGRTCLDRLKDSLFIQVVDS